MRQVQEFLDFGAIMIGKSELCDLESATFLRQEPEDGSFPVLSRHRRHADVERITDDDPDTLQLLSVMLTDSKAGVQRCSSVAEALDILTW